MAARPASGPSASTQAAYCHPTLVARRGKRSIVTMVSRKPSEVCSVSAVPVASTGARSLTSAENCAESATTAKPHTITST